MILVSDFDGTLIRVNSFPKWILFVLKKSFLSFNLTLLFFVTVALVKRKFFSNISHLEFKQIIDGFDYPKGWSFEFVTIIFSKYKSEAVLSEIGKFSFESLLITTAAPECYAQAIPFVLKKDNIEASILCSRMVDNEFVDNYQQQKKKLALKYIKDEEFIFFTDHYDDLALAKYAQTLYLCNPSARNKQVFDACELNYKIINDSFEK